MEAAMASPFMVLKRRMAVHGLGFKPWRKERAAVTFTPGKDWVKIHCSRKHASGCGDHGGKVLEGLTLYVRSTDRADLTSSMCICLSDEARRSIEAEFGRVPPGAVHAEAGIKIATERLLVIIVVFRITHHSERVYYLVYDATDTSLCMVPYAPAGVVACYTATLVPRFTGAGRDYELVLLARKFWTQRLNRELVCVCAPATGVWKVKVRHFPEIPHAFSADEMFSFQGKLFWADLYQGLVCCDGDDLHTTGDDSVVKFDFISLPYGYLLEDQTESAKKTRTISCIGSSIQFVCLDRHHSSAPGRNEPVMEVWTLDLDRRRWNKDQEGYPCPWREFLRQVRFMDDAEARGVEPQYPVLLPGGALCLVLANMYLRRRMIRGFVEESDYIYSFDMRSKRPLWFGLVRDCSTIEPVILPCDFFDPPLRHKRKLPSESSTRYYPNQSRRLSAREKLK